MTTKYQPVVILNRTGERFIVPGGLSYETADAAMQAAKNYAAALVEGGVYTPSVKEIQTKDVEVAESPAFYILRTLEAQPTDNGDCSTVSDGQGSVMVFDSEDDARAWLDMLVDNDLAPKNDWFFILDYRSQDDYVTQCKGRSAYLGVDLDDSGWGSTANDIARDIVENHLNVDPCSLIDDYLDAHYSSDSLDADVAKSIAYESGMGANVRFTDDQCDDLYGLIETSVTALLDDANRLPR